MQASKIVELLGGYKVTIEMDLNKFIMSFLRPNGDQIAFGFIPEEIWQLKNAIEDLEILRGEMLQQDPPEEILPPGINFLTLDEKEG